MAMEGRSSPRGKTLVDAKWSCLCETLPSAWSWVQFCFSHYVEGSTDANGRQLTLKALRAEYLAPSLFDLWT